MENKLFFYNTKSESRAHLRLFNISLTFFSMQLSIRVLGWGFPAKGLSLTNLATERKILANVFKIIDNAMQDTWPIFSLHHLAE